MNRWNCERMLGWAATLAVSALLVTALPGSIASVLGQGSALACFGLCVAAVVAEPARRP
jgi:hypothetical protein